MDIIKEERKQTFKYPKKCHIYRIIKDNLHIVTGLLKPQSTIDLEARSSACLAQQWVASTRYPALHNAIQRMRR
jgi:hypothetical protein